MRVALIALHFAEYAARLALALAAAGDTIQLHLSAPNAGRELDEGLLARLNQAVDLRLHPHPARKSALRHGAGIAASLRRFGPQLIHAQEAADWTMFVARRLGPSAPFVLTVHDPLPHSGDDLAASARTDWPRRRLRREADAAIVHGGRVIADMLTAEPALVGKVHPVMHGILGEPPSFPTARQRDRLLFFGRIEAYKGLDVLLDAARILDERGVSYRLTIAGRGQDLDRHRAAIAAMPRVTLDDRFIPADEVPALFAESAAVVMPYLDATQSGVAAHAFASATPVIASRVGALPDVVTDGVNGLLVPPGDGAGLADAMSRLLTEPALAGRLSDGAAEAARTVLAWDSIAAATRAVYAAALARREGSR